MKQHKCEQENGDRLSHDCHMADRDSSHDSDGGEYEEDWMVPVRDSLA